MDEEYLTRKLLIPDFEIDLPTEYAIGNILDLVPKELWSIRLAKAFRDKGFNHEDVELSHIIEPDTGMGFYQFTQKKY